MTPRKINPPHYFGLSLVAMACLRYLVGGEPLLGNVAWVGIAPILAGITIAMLGARQFARAGTNIVPLTPSSALVTDGVFAWSRNPMYTGMSAVLVGTALLLDRAWPWIVLPIFIATLRLRFISYEEQLMEATFGPQYVDYKRRVRRWI